MTPYTNLPKVFLIRFMKLFSLIKNVKGIHQHKVSQSCTKGTYKQINISEDGLGATTCRKQESRTRVL